MGREPFRRKKYFEEHGQTFKTTLSTKVMGVGGVGESKTCISKAKRLIIGPSKRF